MLNKLIIKNLKKPTIPLYISEKINNIIFLIFSLYDNFPANKIIKIGIKVGIPKMINNSIISPPNSIFISSLQMNKKLNELSSKKNSTRSSWQLELSSFSLIAQTADCLWSF